MCIKMEGKACASIRKSNNASHNGGLDESRRIMLASEVDSQYDNTSKQNNHYQKDPPLGQGHFLKMHDVERRYYKLDRQFTELKRALQLVVDNTISRQTTHSELNEIVKEWRLLAKVIDRFCIVVYFFAITASLLTLFPRPQAAFDSESYPN